MQLAAATQSTKQSATAIKQGTNIRILTLITITYLPLSLATSVFGMDIMPSTVNFGTFTWVLATALFLTILGVCYLENITNGVQAFGNLLASQTARIQSTSSINLSSSRNSNAADVQKYPATSGAERVDKEYSDTPQISMWTNFIMLMRYLVITFPASEIIKFIIAAQALLDRSTTECSQYSEAHQSNNSLESAVSDNTSAGPAPDYYSLKACTKRFEQHIKSCNTCRAESAFLLSCSLCGVGSSLMNSIIEAKEDRINYRKTPTTRRRTASHSVHSADQFEQFVQGRTGPANNILGLQTTNTMDSILKSGRVDKQVAARPWLRTVAHRAMQTFGFMRVLTVPFCACVLLIEYMTILAWLALLGIFVDLGLEETGATGNTGFVNVATQILARPVQIIFVDTVWEAGF